MRALLGEAEGVFEVRVPASATQRAAVEAVTRGFPERDPGISRGTAGERVHPVVLVPRRL